MHYVILHATIKLNKKEWQSCLLSTLKHYIFGFTWTHKDIGTRFFEQRRE